jgi:predicted lactoylglutathione lyase
MSTIDTSSELATASAPVSAGEFRLEAVVVPVADVDRAKDFYEGLGWRFDIDFKPTPAPGRDPEGLSYRTRASFSDPDGNGWQLQEITERLPGR